MIHSILSASAAMDDTSKTIAQQTGGGSDGSARSKPSQAREIIRCFVD